MAKLYWKDLKTYLLEWVYYVKNKNSRVISKKQSNPLYKNIEETVDFTLRNVQYTIDFLPNKDVGFLQGKKLLEIGPG